MTQQAMSIKNYGCPDRYKLNGQNNENEQSAFSGFNSVEYRAYKL